MVVDSWIWALEPSHFRVLFAVVALAAPRPTVVRSPIWGVVPVPAGGLVTSLDRLAERTDVSRAVVRRALERLAAGPARDGVDGAIIVTSSPRGYTLITLAIPALVAACAQHEHGATAGLDSGIAPIAPALITQGQSRSEHSNTPTRTGSVTQPITAPATVNPSGGAELKDSAPHREHSDSTAGEHSGASVSQGGGLSDPDLNPDQKDHNPPTGKRRGKRGEANATLAAKIPVRAWAAADFLRDQILVQDPGNIVRRKPWGPDVREGWRLQWANEIRLMVEQDHRGRPTGAPRDDEKAYDEIAKAASWVFKGQGDREAQWRIVVESATSFRAKWEKIQAGRRRQVEGAAQPSRNQPATAYRDPPERKAWT